jgi:hypothetical protein
MVPLQWHWFNCTVPVIEAPVGCCVRWKLREFLDGEGISVHRLLKQVGGSVSRTGLYRIARSQTCGLAFSVLDSILDGLEAITGREARRKEILSQKRAVDP